MNHKEATADVMLAIARDAIDGRAVRDGHKPGEYEAEHDPEGYITSLLNALHQWTHRHGIDWDKELASAQGFFEQDLAELAGATSPLPEPTIQDLRCPACGHTESFLIEVTESVLMCSDGTTLGDEQHWGDWSYCTCQGCKHAGTVYQFRIAVQERR